MSSSDINIDELTKEVNSELNTSNESPKSNNNMILYLKKCVNAPLIYITTVPILSAIILYIIKPNYMFDKDPKNPKKKILNTTKYLKLITLASVILNAFIYFYLIKQCKMNI